MAFKLQYNKPNKQCLSISMTPTIKVIIENFI